MSYEINEANVSRFIVGINGGELLELDRKKVKK